MSDLLNKASLVMVPSGYKEDTVYSVVPSDGSGDLSFTRASNGTRINSAGLVEVCPWNLLGYSEEFNNAYWIKDSSTITANDAIAPNGTTTADKFTTTSTTAECQVRASNFSILSNVGIPFTTSVYAKKGTANFLRIRNLFSSVTVVERNGWFNLNTGTLGTIDSGQTGTITDVGNGWYRCTLTGLVGASGNANLVDIGFTNTDNTYFPTTSVNGYLWGAQLNIGSTAKPYFPTTDRLNVPRLTYQNGGGGCPSLLLEKQSTNVVLNSEDFSNASWLTSNVTLTANQTTSPDGTQNADSLIPNTTNTTIHRIFESAINSIATASYSIFVKPNGYYRVALRECETTGSSIGFDLLNETIITTYSTGGCTASGGKIENMGNGWYRISGIFSFASATSQRLGLYVVSSSWTSGDPESVSWAGNGTSGVYLYGAQMEASSYPTSYIPTTSSSATRVADACSKTGISSLIGQTQGAFFIDVDLKSRLSYSYFLINNSTSNYIGVQFATTTIQLEVVNTSVLQSAITLSNSATGRFKIAGAYANNDFVLYINGTQVGTGTSGSVPATNQVDLYYNATNTIQYNEVVLFKTRLTNAELQALTA
jgi:hypothetical protein